MKGVIKNYRRGRKTHTPNQVIVEVSGINAKKDASNLIGKKVTWGSPAGKELTGKVADAHGNSGAVRVTFRKGMPGQSIGKIVSVSD